jgi:hypothetical protein
LGAAKQFYCSLDNEIETAMDEQVLFEPEGVPFWLSVGPEGLDESDCRHVRKCQDVQILCVVLDAPDQRSGVSLGGPVAQASSLLSEEGTFPDLERVQLSGNRILRRDERKFDKINRAAPGEIMEFLASRPLECITLVQVDVGADVFSDFLADCQTSKLRLSGVRIIPTKHQRVELAPHLEWLELSDVGQGVVLFVAQGIRKQHRLHVTLGNDAEDGRLDMNTWDALREGTGGYLAGVRAVTFRDGPRFDNSCVVWNHLLRCDSVRMVNLVGASFNRHGFSSFLNYLSDWHSPVRQVGMIHWELVDGFGERDEFDEFLSAIRLGPVVWYSHRRVSCAHAEKIANALPSLGLEALQLEIVRNNIDDTFIPTQQLLQAARATRTLGVFNDPLRAARAEALCLDGLSATGTNRYDYDWYDYYTYFDVFSEEEEAELQRLFRRNRQMNDEMHARLKRGRQL